ncbi:MULTISPECIES: hypothetical protein [Pseudoalteromonas]|uniref:Uncharacterized protein n=1 Tax=Pseudoalteromonas amylolytica TaxID=1859457 RepID=A0A1S1MTA2_9GAMM|nr:MULTISPECIES: hypothetical protein [Pseudoalteromonas]OHU89194.1 hypothetical protein BFC16_06035 [Pseudoalteromonas sp. JW3]OHU92094.1 hypothetical protein BET10_07140 [Pseudoalteromonas amylolytica]
MSTHDKAVSKNSGVTYAWSNRELRQQMDEKWLVIAPLRPEFNQAAHHKIKEERKKRQSNMVEQEACSPELRPNNSLSLSVLRKHFEKQWQVEFKNAQQQHEAQREVDNDSNHKNTPDFPEFERSR